MNRIGMDIMGIGRITRTAGAFALAAGLAVGTAACGSSQNEGPYSAGEAGEQQAMVVVDNTNSGVSDVTIWLEGEFGTRQRLGSVGLGGEETFVVDELDWGGQFVLVGDPLGDPEIQSRAFRINPGTTVEWRIRDNTLYASGEQ